MQVERARTNVGARASFVPLHRSVIVILAFATTIGLFALSTVGPRWHSASGFAWVPMVIILVLAQNWVRGRDINDILRRKK